MRAVFVVTPWDVLTLAVVVGGVVLVLGMIVAENVRHGIRRRRARRERK